MSSVALVTGAAQGLGQFIVKKLYETGYSVVATDANLNGVEELALGLDPSGKKVLPLRLDVLEKENFIQALEKTIEIFGSCDLLVNNAALTPTTPVLEISAEEFNQVININLRGTFFGCQVFGEYFAKNDYGRIVNLASLAGQTGGAAAGAHYASSKGGILTLTKIFARQFADAKVTVNAIAPGPIDVPSIRDKIPAEKLKEIIENMIPVKSMSDPDFIADMVVMLADKNAGTVTGACWDINGGIFMR